MENPKQFILFLVGANQPNSIIFNFTEKVFFNNTSNKAS